MRERLHQWCIIVLAALAIAFGGLWRQERAANAAYSDALFCWRIIHADAAWRDVDVRVSTHPRAAVFGEVESAADRDRLEKRLLEEMGSDRRARIAFNVKVK